MKPLPSPLLVVTDRHAAPLPEASADDRGTGGGAGQEPDESESTRRLSGIVQAVLDGGARWIWFRERDMEADARIALARVVLGLVRERGGHFTIGGDSALAAATGADGMHLPGAATHDDIRRARDRLPRHALIGVSAHGVRDVETAARAGADYATLSPIYPSASKPGYGPALGPDVFREAAGSGIPVIALGGITSANTAECRLRGAGGIAVMGGVMRDDAPGTAVRRLLDAWRA